MMNFLLLLTAIVAVVDSAPACDLKSSAFQALIQKGVIANESPAKSNGRLCSPEWQEYGSCCEEDSASTYLASDKDQIEQSNREAAEQLDSTVENLNRFARHIESSDIKLDQPESSLFTSVVAKLREIQGMVFVQNASRSACQSALTALREAALCAVCSARASRYYFEDRLILQETLCSAALTKCLPSWGLNVKVVDTMDMVKALLKRIQPRFPKLRSLDFSAVEELEKWLKSRMLSKRLSRCDYNSNTCPAKAATSICEWMITFQQPTFAQVAVSVFKQESTEMKKIGDFEFKIHRKVQVTNTSQSNTQKKTTTAADGSEVTETVDTHTHTSEKKEETTITQVQPSVQNTPNPPAAVDEWKVETKPSRLLSLFSGRLLLLKTIIQRRESIVVRPNVMPIGCAPIAQNLSSIDGP